MGKLSFLLIVFATFLTSCTTPAGSSSGGVGTGRPGVFVSPQALQITNVGIMPFKAATTLIGDSVSDQFVTEMMKLGRYDLVERAQMTGVLGETEIILSGLTAGEAARLGQMAGAEGVIIGTVSEYETVARGGRTYPVVGISVRLIDCNSGKILWSVDHAAQGGRNDTLARQSRKVVHDMALALGRHLN
ncbi:MAG: hypothetical protein GX804_04855 [Lentisphaerae bacterium]|jgi:curli biogenesis system outer membrane secretion channel CsgG|nr:hypothetical protein [Lentisphaerota bacterium]